MDKQVRLIVMGVIVLIGFIVLFNTVKWVKVEGNEAVVWQNLWKGVLPEVGLSGTHFYCGIITTAYKYNIGTQKITFADKGDAEYKSIMVNLGEEGGQSAWISVSLNYRIGWKLSVDGTPEFSPKRLIALHNNGLRNTYRSVIIKRTVLDVINKIARPQNALDIYSGKGFVAFKEAVAKMLKSHPVFSEHGIFIENVIVYNVDLRPEYEKEIARKKLAEQTFLRKKEETKAAEQEARRAFAEAQAQVERRRQDAEGLKIERVKAAEAEAQERVLRAEATKKEVELEAAAEKQKRILEAQGTRDANIARAQGIEALGKAEAIVAKLKRDAMYAEESGKRRTLVEMQKAKAQIIKGMLNGVNVIPEKTVMFLGKEAMGTTINIDSDTKK